MTHAHDHEALDTPVRPVRQREDHDHAWQVARRVVASGSSRAAEPHSLLRLQRMAGNGGVGSLVAGEEERSPVLDVVGRGGGSPLPTPVRSEMEQGLGADFASVRVHTDGAAAASAQAVQAKAYTVGDEIVFNQGAYQPDSDAGRHTLAHELTHVVQQRSGPVDGTATGDGVAISDPGDRFEQAAEASATALMTGNTTAESGAPAVQRHAGDHDDATPVQREDLEEEEAVQETALQREELEDEAMG